MPTQLPLESTDLFGDLLIPHTFDILKSDASKPLENHNFSYSVHSVNSLLFFFQLITMSILYLYLYSFIE